MPIYSETTELETVFAVRITPLRKRHI